MAHGVIDRFTADVDLFTDREAGVAAAADAVETALRDARFHADRQAKSGGWLTYSRGWAKGSPSGSSPHPPGSR